MALKICHNNEIHKISKAPTSLFELRNKVNSVFRDNLHTHYRLEYLDHDGDHVTISNQESYHELIKNELAGPVKSIKIYVVAVRDTNVKNTSTGEQPATRKASGPIHIQNKEEFAKELPKPGPKTSATRLGRSDAPSDESLPSSDEDHEEKIQGINEAVEDLKRQGKVNLQPKIYEDVQGDKEKKKLDKKKKDDDKGGEKEQKKMKKLMDKIREKELSEEKKAKVVKKLIRYKDSLATKQQANATKQQQQQQASRYVEPRSPLELVVTQIVQSMIPEITRMTGGQLHPTLSTGTRRDRSNEEKTKAIQQAEKASHPRIICDGCHMRPIVGVRYKCTVCPNFDYCEDCEDKMGHQHPFIKIKTPQQDYFSPGFLLDPLNKRPCPARVASEKDHFHHDFSEPAYGFNSMWAGRPSGFALEAASSQKTPKSVKENVPAEKPKIEQQQQQQQHEQLQQQHQQQQQQKQKQQRRELHQHQQQQSHQYYQQHQQRQQHQLHQQQQNQHYQQHFPQHQYYLQHQYVQKPKAETKTAEREKENVGPSQSSVAKKEKKDRRDEVEIEDEPYDRALVSHETNVLKEKQNQEWVPKKGDDLKGLEKEKKKGDVKNKAGQLKKEFPNVDADTLIRFVKEAPEDLSTDDLVKNFLSWR